VLEDFSDPYQYNEEFDGDVNLDVDGDVNLDVDGDESKKNNVQFNNFDPKELENIKVDGCHRSAHLKIWAFNTFDTWCLYIKLEISMSIANLHVSNRNLIIDCLSHFMLQVAKEDG
jgi:hypothetical protein